MKAIQITQTGGPEVMSIREVPTPVPGPGEVLIRVAARGVNFIDLYIRDHVVELHVHLIQSLLHVLYVLDGTGTRLSRWRRIELTLQTACSGRNDPRSNPTECRYYSHWSSPNSSMS